MHAGLHGPERNTDAHRHLGQGKPEVVVEDQHGALLDGEPPEGAVELNSMFNGLVLVSPVHGLDGEPLDPLGPARATPGLGVAGIGEDPVEPRVEGLGIPQGANLAPRGQQGRLDGVISSVCGLIPRQ